ncbi:MAG: hypothetical protein A3C13_00710 [Candidatus Lloydbacteria bacterium RIFCSPHIGHO2_02_FULL_50_11]|nr:MAG: hypothetical protein A3C13_00710 [Candidatus Lloydbacteria bacterium RIFCSPHIGHO2_02_FULL_50_11]
MIIKTIFQPKIVFVVVAILILGGILVVLRDTERDKPQTAEVQLDESCREDADCVLVQEGWCKTVLAVRQSKETEWKEEDAEQVETARQNQQTCEPMPAEYLDIGNFSAVCKQSRCVAELIVDN